MTRFEPASDRDLPPRPTVRQRDGAAVVVLPAHLPIDALLPWLRDGLPEALAELGEDAVRLDLGERDLEPGAVDRLVGLVRGELGLDLLGAYATTDAVHRCAERALGLELLVDDDGDAQSPGPLPGLAEVEALLRGEDPRLAALVAAVAEAGPVQDRRFAATLRRWLRLRADGAPS